MLGLYLGTLAFGAVLMGVSLLFGGSDFEHDLDCDLDHDLDFGSNLDVDLVSDVDHDAPGGLSTLSAPGESNLWLPFASMRFYTFFSFAFGLSGTIMSLFSVPVYVVFGCSFFVAFGIGWLAAWTFRALYRDVVSGDVGLQRYVGQEARVLLPVQSGQRGKIVLQTPMGSIELPAETRDDGAFAPQDVVLIAHIDHGVANITSTSG
jgi:hypothetical protein